MRIAVKRAFLAVSLLISSFSEAQTILPVIPQPNFNKSFASSFKVGQNTFIYSKESSFEANYLKAEISKLYGIKIKIESISTNTYSVIDFVIDKKDTTHGKEWYYLLISEKGIRINAADEAGIFYGIETLLQLVKKTTDNKIEIPCCEIRDEPQYQWRGMHLDVCRHFFTKKEIKKYIDYLALYKFNVFHWHLTEDQGWRIEIKKYPKLTQIGAWRKGSQVGAYKDQKFDTLRYGGFYTQEDVKEIVAYASQRHITIVPEIEMPGHSLAALAAYPQFSCTGGPFEVAKGWGVFDDVYCPKEETFKFLEDVLNEVCALFPGKYIHIGGDECPKTRWKTCPHCQALIKKENLKDEHELQSYFITRI